MAGRWPAPAPGRGAARTDRGHSKRPIADRLSGLGAALQALAKSGVTMNCHQVHKVLGQGNFVLITSEGEFASKHSAFYGLFRVRRDKLAEHRDTIETIPARPEWMNANGKV